MFSSLGAVVNHFFEEADDCQAKHPSASILLSSVALEATLYRKLLPSRHALKHLFNICDLERLELQDLIRYARRLGLLDKKNRKRVDYVREIRNCVVHPTTRNLKRLANRHYPDMLDAIKTRIRPSGEIPPGEKEFQCEALFFARIKELSRKTLKNTETVLKFIDKKSSFH